MNHAIDIGAVLQAIYDSEINASISWEWDGGVDVCGKIGSET